MGSLYADRQKLIQGIRTKAISAFVLEICSSEVRQQLQHQIDTFDFTCTNETERTPGKYWWSSDIICTSNTSKFNINCPFKTSLHQRWKEIIEQTLTQNEIQPNESLIDDIANWDHSEREIMGKLSDYFADVLCNVIKIPNIKRSDVRVWIAPWIAPWNNYFFVYCTEQETKKVKK